MQPIVLRLDPESRHKLEQLAKATGISRSTLVAEAVRRFVDEELAALVARAKEEQSGKSENQDTPPDGWNIIV